jgi:hypothetical protein
VIPVPRLWLFLALCLDNIPTLRPIKRSTPNVLNVKSLCSLRCVIILHRPQVGTTAIHCTCHRLEQQPYTARVTGWNNSHTLHVSQVGTTAIHCTCHRLEQQPYTARVTGWNNSHTLHVSQVGTTAIHCTCHSKGSCTSRFNKGTECCCRPVCGLIRYIEKPENNII